jgi:hypothetical protein
MAADDKKTNATPPQKKEIAPMEKPVPPKDNSASGEAPKPEGGKDTADAPSGYSRGEGQKPVTKAYKENRNAIFANKKKKR